MLKFAAKRCLMLIPLLFGISLFASVFFYIVPGDIVRVMLGQHVDPQTYANVRRSLGLDMSFWDNVIGFYKGLLRGELGYSYTQQRPVIQIIGEALPVTIKLAAAAVAVTVGLGVPAGIWAALRDKRLMGNIINMGAIAGISMPSFLLALFLQLTIGIGLGWLPVSGTGAGYFSYILPGLALGLPLAASYCRVARASMLEVLGHEYILFAAARGLSVSRVIIRHALPNAMIPVITQLGMDLGMLVTGAVLTETIFNLPGIGRLLFASVNFRDFPVIRGLLLLFAAILVITNLLVDVFYARLDPRLTTEIVRDEPDAIL